MQFADYPAFRVALQWMLEGEELTGTFSVDSLDLMVGLAEARINRDLRASSMLADLSVVVASNRAVLPANLLELQEVYFSGERPLEIVPLERLRTLEKYGGGGASRYAAQDGDALRFFPAATGTAIGRYYAKPDALKTGGLHATFNRYPEVYFFGSLVEAVPFLGFDSKLGMWEAKYQQALANAMQDERMRVYGGSRLRVRSQ